MDDALGGGGRGERNGHGRLVSPPPPAPFHPALLPLPLPFPSRLLPALSSSTCSLPARSPSNLSPSTCSLPDLCPSNLSPPTLSLLAHSPSTASPSNTPPLSLFCSQVEARALPEGPSNPFHNAFIMHEEELLTTGQAQRDVNFGTARCGDHLRVLPSLGEEGT